MRTPQERSAGSGQLQETRRWIALMISDAVPASSMQHIVFIEISDGSWLVEVWSALKRVTVRITTAEQVHIQQYVR
ncbi:hypothetical protein ABZ837_40755 [Streptomyces sp. NPDC047197]|uniref:hypothetical protein n=1 Tax=Streptomyces sp. NPDC047197 TaxID=3155477 RepID=UPI003408C17D